MMHLVRSGFVGALLAAGVTTSAFAQTAWDMPTPYGDGIFHTQNIREFADDVKTATDGNLVITVHSANSLFGHAEIRDAVRDGLVPIGEFLLSRLVNEDPVFGLDSIPFLASSYEESTALWDVSKDAISEKLAAQGLTLLYSVPWPGQSLYLRKEVTDPKQLEGLNFRAYNLASERLAQLLGAIPTQVEETDVATAFSTGRVEAMITSPSTGANAKAWDFTSNFIDVQAWLPRNVVVVNTEAFEALTDAERKALTDAAATAQTRGLEMSKEETAAKIAELEKGGMKISKPSEALSAKLKEVGETMTTEWQAKAGDTGKAIIEAYRNR
ncbi:TRAP transporter substrate-binding protein [Tianweitania sp. BSSL-BM11]|uniref:TRAP transporter substrate-binding protein n=1 Tax=Tianweitania aestuarii TaxID=2814886 RepID=A0ABS5RY93_9HYPH|nr:TRAP transporter substrate-binding protein [Tianweitania aestuarii]MBS9722005.1 TRAP transporter substrate-binding protein [Tianweitania aestuarii]